MKIVVVSAHPDDAETAAGGLIAMAAKEGHEVVRTEFLRIRLQKQLRQQIYSALGWNFSTGVIANSSLIAVT